MTDQSASTSPSALLSPQHSATLPTADNAFACGACGCPEWECLDLSGDDQCCSDCGHSIPCGRCGKGDSGDHAWDCLDGERP